jgi:hypothetical protein
MLTRINLQPPPQINQTLSFQPQLHQAVPQASIRVWPSLHLHQGRRRHHQSRFLHISWYFTPPKHLKYISPNQLIRSPQIGNTAGYTLDDWINDITQAQAARIDGFALNVGPQDSYTDNSLTNAYTAAEQRNFKLFISFDYLSAGPWSSPQVIQKIKSFADSPAQFKVDGKPLVSTFEGVSSAGDWSAIKAAVPIYFVPDWSSVGPGGFSQYLSDVDGACRFLPPPTPLFLLLLHLTTHCRVI